MDADLPAYFKTWSHEIASRADRVRQLIGSRHWLSDGVHKEFLVKEFLSRHLPSDLHLGRGFIRRLDTDRVSPEVDIILADPRRHVPLFREGDIQIVPPSSVLATLEIKSTYRKQVLRDALTNVSKVRSVGVRAGSAADVWSGIMFGSATDDLTLQSVVTDLRSILGDGAHWAGTLDDQVEIHRHCRLPSLICILDFCLVIVESDGPEKPVRLRAFEGGAGSAALAFAQLFAFLRATFTSSSLPGELDVLLERVDGLPTITASAEVPKQ